MRLDITQPIAAPRRHAVRQHDARIKTDIWRGVVLGVIQAVLVCIVIGAVYFAWPWLKLTFDKPIARVIIKGDLMALNEQTIRNAVVIYENDTFLSIDLTALVDRLENHSWIAHARARRQWPDTVEITLVEQKPIAYWGDKAMVNAKGRVFEHQGLAAGRSLPRLWSELGSPAEIMSHYQIFEQQLEPLHLKLQAISQSVQGDWRLQLDNGLLVVLDRVDPVGNVRNFVGVYNQLLASSERRALAVDMRYRHGAAIHWEEPVQPAIKAPGKGSDKVSGMKAPAKAGDMLSRETGSVEAGKEWLQIKSI